MDIRIGLDEQIILVSYDSDFVSAAKAVTKGGIGFVLDSMWNSVSDDLHESISTDLVLLVKIQQNRLAEALILTIYEEEFVP